MNPPPPQVFISATTGDLGAVRQVVKGALLTMGCHPVEQANFSPDYRTIARMLEEKIKGCEAVIHIVGMRYGFEPDPEGLPEGAARRSYTQMEYDLARKLGKKVYVFVCPEDYPYQTGLGEEPEELRQMQVAHRSSILGGERHWTRVKNPTEVELNVQKLQIELDELRHGLRRSNTRFAAVIGLVFLTLLAIAVGLWAILQQGESQPERLAAEVAKIYEDPDVLAAKIKGQIRSRADEVIAEAKAGDADWRKINQIEHERDEALGKVDGLIETIRIGLAGRPNPILAEAARLLAEEGVAEALAYLESKRPTIESQSSDAELRRDREEIALRDALEPWLLEARLRVANLEFEKALEIFSSVVKKAPGWSLARLEMGKLLVVLARHKEAERHLMAALDSASDDGIRSQVQNELGTLFKHTARFEEAETQYWESVTGARVLLGEAHPNVAAALNNLAGVFESTNRPVEAEKIYRETLDAAVAHYGPDHPVVAVRLNNLAAALEVSNRLSEAEPLYRRALEIDEAKYGSDHPNVARDLNNLAIVLESTSRLEEAEKCKVRAVKILESNFGKSHPSVATALSNLGQLYLRTNRLEQAEECSRRAVSTFEFYYGPKHPDLATALNNLGMVVERTRRFSEAEVLYRRAMEIDKAALGPDHRDLARDLNNLAGILRATGHPLDAENLYRQALAIGVKTLGPEDPRIALRLNNLANLLASQKRFDEAERTSIRAVEVLRLHERKNGTPHPYLKPILTNLIAIQRAMGKGTGGGASGT